MKTKVTKVKGATTETTSSYCENARHEDKRHANPLQEYQCNCTTNNFIHHSDESNIQLVREFNATTTVDDELDRETLISPKQDPTEGGQTIAQD